MKKSSRKPKALEPALHKTFVESCLYQPTEESGNRRYGFRFIARSFQKKLQSLFIQVFESDLIFNKTNKAYRSERQEPKAWTHWYREMAEVFCQENFWDTLRQHAKSAEAVDAINQLQRNHETHKLFAHHTTESLLFVGRFVLPPLQRQCRRAERTFQRWSKVFFWLPNAFKTHYKHYLATLQNNVNVLQSGITLSLQHRLVLARESFDGKTDDVLFSLIDALRFEAPNFLSDEQLVQVLESPSSTNDAFMRAFDKKFLLPTKRRQSTFQAQAECVAFLHEHPESRAWINTWLDKKLHSSSAIKLHMIKHNTPLMLLPENWLEQNQKSTSFKRIRREQPWLKHWTLSHGIELLRAQRALERLTPEPGENPFSANANTALLFDDFDAVTEAQAMLKAYQDTLKNFPLKSSFSWWPFSKKSIMQNKALEKTIRQIDENIRLLDNAKAEWILLSNATWEAHAETYQAETWNNIIRCVYKVMISGLGKREVETDNQLKLCYQRLCIRSAAVLSNQPPTYHPAHEARAFAQLKKLAEAKSIAHDDWCALKDYERDLTKKPTLEALWTEQIKDILQQIETQWLLAIQLWANSSQEQVKPMTPELANRARIHLIQSTQLLQVWSPAFHQRETTKKAFQSLWQGYLEQGKIQSENNAHRIDLLESILIYGQGELAERAKALRAVRIQKDRLDDFKAQCEEASQQSHEAREKNDAGASSSKSKGSSQQSPIHSQDNNPKGFFAQAPSITPQATQTLFDPAPFIAIFEQALTGQGHPPLPEVVAKVLLTASEIMSRSNAEDVRTWYGRATLKPNIRGLLQLDNKPRTGFLGVKDSLVGRQVPRFMMERCKIINMAAKVYKIAALPQTEQSDALVMLQQPLRELQKSAYTPHVSTFCGTLLDLADKTLQTLPPPIYSS